MSRRLPIALAVVFAALAAATPARAQNTPKGEGPEAPRAERRDRTPTAALRVQLVITRLQGEKKIASLPYTFVVTAGGDWARMRMGVDTPIPMSPPPSSEAQTAASYQYRNVGTKIDCRATERGDRYQVFLGVENSSALTGPGASVGGAPLFRRFETSLDLLLRDGQSVQTVASTDPVTGEVVKIDVTLHVVK